MGTQLYFTNGKPVIMKGSYRGQDYAIISHGSHPCAYIETDKGSLFDNDDLDCHGGVTWRDFHEDVNHYCVGWDYAHSCDYTNYFPSEDGKKWSLEEIDTEVRQVIDSVLG